MFEIKTLKDGLKKIAPRTKTRAITDDDNKSLDTILSEKANSTDVPSKVSQLTNDTGFITNAALADYPNNTQMNAAISSHHDDTKQDKLTFAAADFNVTNNNVSLNPTKFASYLLKSDAPGYNDILTKTLASTTYETKANASAAYVSKTEAVGYDDILTKTDASATYETKANASTTYETKANATATYETKANTSDVLSLEEIQASADLSGKIASASAFTPFFNVKQGNLASCEYIQIGKLVVVSFKGTLSNKTALGIPPLKNNCIITLRDESVGGIAQVCLDRNAIIVTGAGSSNFVDGHNYSGFFAYVRL